MQVTVNLYGELMGYLPTGKRSPLAVKAAEGCCAADLLSHLGVPSELPLAVVVNGGHRDPSYRLADGDVLSIFSLSAFHPGLA
ncbi:MAG: ubiquitin family protein [Chloroflexota bacterium]